MNYIHNNPGKFLNATISFGTPRDYFKAIKERTKKFDTLKGDFFPYAETFQDRVQSYWTGYYTTRPFYKMMSRELEHNLRSAEIVFAIAWNKACQNNQRLMEVFEKNYKKLIEARRNLGLFQHHDAITGTSQEQVMEDYGKKLFESIQDSVDLQKISIESLIQSKFTNNNFLISSLKRIDFDNLPKKVPINVTKEMDIQVVLYNSLAQKRVEVVTLKVTSPNIKVLDPKGKVIPHQINPVFFPQQDQLTISNKLFYLLFLVKIPPLSLVTYTLSYSSTDKCKLTKIYCKACKGDSTRRYRFTVKSLESDNLQLKNNNLLLKFDEKSHRLESVLKNKSKQPMKVSINFGIYRSVRLRSGAYLFKPDGESSKFLKDKKVFVVTGPLTRDVTIVYETVLSHTVRIFNTETYLDDNIFLINGIDFTRAQSPVIGEIFMRIETGIENGENPKMYSDLNGFQWQPRQKVSDSGIEGNYYPMSNAAFIQDNKTRFSLITAHAQGVAGFETGKLEVMLDRRTLYDDNRGLARNVVDSKLTRQQIWLSLENFAESSSDAKLYQLPSLQTNQLINSLNHPVNIYYVENPTKSLKLLKNLTLLNYNLPCDIHIFNLRTLTNLKYHLIPSPSALLILHRQGYDCRINPATKFCSNENVKLNGKNLFKFVNVSEVQRTSLTGLHLVGKANESLDYSVDPMDLKTFKLTF